MTESKAEKPSSGKPKKRGGVGVRILICLMFLVALCAGAGLGAALAGTVNVMNTENFEDFDTAIPTRVLDINGELITEFAGDERREIVAFQDLPQSLIDALLIREDRIFYTHHGFSVKAVLRALVGIISGSSLGGGSTLTQQIAGTLYLNRQEYSIQRKIRELWWAIQMERRYSKDEILELYLNKIYFGGGTYGVSAACDYYFAHDVQSLSPAEAAILVIQLSNPSYYNPFEHPNRAMARQQGVLTDMVAAGYITQDEADESFDAYWSSFDYTRTGTSAVATRTDKAPWFSEYVRRELSGMLYGSQDIYSGGFTVHTSVNLAHQQAAEQILGEYIDAANLIYRRTMSSHEREAFSKYVPFAEALSLIFNIDELDLSQERNETTSVTYYRDRINPVIDILSMIGGVDSLKTGVVNKGNALSKQVAEETTIEGTMVALDNSTGYIDALVGGSNYSADNQFIRATQARLQPGSTFKPLYYSEAIESKKFTMTTVISDTPVVFHKEDGTPYIPQDFRGEWEGDVELWYALAHSMNVPSLKVLDAIGFEAAISRASSLLGIPEGDLAERHFDPVYPLGLGVCAVRPIELASAYATIANRGREVRPIAILYVEDSEGNVILNPAQDRIDEIRSQGAKQLLSEEGAFLMQEIMKNTVRSGTLAYGSNWDSTYWVTGERKGRGSKFRFTDADGNSFTMPAAGKTGTTQNWADAWAAGFTPYITSVFWFGFDRPGQSLGLSITGSTIAGVAWGDFMNAANQGLPYKPFFNETPGDIIECEVCTESGGLYIADCGNHRMTAYYYPGTEPTEFCGKHGEFGTESVKRTLAETRLRVADLASGASFEAIQGDDSPLIADLSFLTSGLLSSERDETEQSYGSQGDVYGSETQTGGTSRDPDDFSNWLLD